MSKRASHRQALRQLIDRFVGVADRGASPYVIARRAPTTADEIERRVDEWHEGGSDLPLHTYLGMTEEAYAAWVQDAGAITLDPAGTLTAFKEKLIDEILRLDDRFNYNPSLDEALNSGDGTYKP